MNSCVGLYFNRTVVCSSFLNQQFTRRRTSSTMKRFTTQTQKIMPIYNLTVIQKCTYTVFFFFLPKFIILIVSASYCENFSVVCFVNIASIRVLWKKQKGLISKNVEKKVITFCEMCPENHISVWVVSLRDTNNRNLFGYCK